MELRADKTGVFTNTLVAKADDGVVAKQTMKITVKQPKLQMTADAPSMRYVGNMIRYSINVKNTGDGNAKNLVAQLQVPEGVKFVKADEGGRPLGNNKVIVWKLASLVSGDTEKLTATFIAEKIMKVNAVVSAKALAAPMVRKSLSTDVKGIPALMLQVDDLQDPVAVGGKVQYKIIITNQGSLDASNVVVQCKLEKTMSFVGGSGPTKVASNKNGVITFKPLRTLGLGKDNKAVWIVEVNAKKAGDVRFTATVKCDQLQRQVSEEESTEFYDN